MSPEDLLPTQQTPILLQLPPSAPGRGVLLAYSWWTSWYS